NDRRRRVAAAGLRQPRDPRPPRRDAEERRRPMSLLTLAARVGAVALTVAGSSALAPTMLTPDQTYSFTLPSGHSTNDLAIDVPASAQQLRITADGPANGDIDLLLRYGGAFPPGSENLGGIEWLYEHAHYVSISPGSTERVT